MAFKSFLFILFLYPLFSSAQEVQLKTSKELVDSLFFANQVEGLEISEKMIPLALQQNDTFYITYFLDQAGELNRMLGNYERAIDQISTCLEYKENWENLRDLSLSYNNLGKTYINRGQYELAAKNLLKALELMEQSDDLQGQAFYLNNLGALYDLQKNYNRALEYYDRSLTVKKALKDTASIASSYTNMGISYFNLGAFEKAVTSFENSIRINSELENLTKLARGYSNLGRTYVAMKVYPKAKIALFKALALRDEVSEVSLHANLLNNLSTYYVAVDNLDSAQYFNDRVIQLPEEQRSWKILKDAFATRAEIAAKKGDFNLAYAALKTSVLYNDSLVNEANIHAVAEMEAKYNYEKNRRIIQDQELDKLRKDRALRKARSQRIYFVIGIAVLVLTSLVLVLLFRAKKRKSDLLEGQNRLIKQQKSELQSLNENLASELDSLQITMEEKERLLNEVFQSSTSMELPPELLSLSKRETEVLGYLALGRSDEEIAQSLFVSKSTVKTHLRRIYSKLLVKNRAEAVAIAHKYSLLAYEAN